MLRLNQLILILESRHHVCIAIFAIFLEFRTSMVAVNGILCRLAVVISIFFRYLLIQFNAILGMQAHFWIFIIRFNVILAMHLFACIVKIV